MCNERVGPRPPIVPRKPNFATAELAADGLFFPEWQGDGNGNLSLREAAELAASFSKKAGGLVKEVKAIGPYVNFYINEKEFGKLALKQILKQKKNKDG